TTSRTRRSRSSSSSSSPDGSRRWRWRLPPRKLPRELVKPALGWLLAIAAAAVLTLVVLACARGEAGGPAAGAENAADAGRAPGAEHDRDAPHGDHATVHHAFNDPAKWAKIFDDPERDAWQKPNDVVAALELKPGMTAADLGAGTGYFTAPLSRAVGPKGAVLSIDPEPEMVEYL